MGGQSRESKAARRARRNRERRATAAYKSEKSWFQKTLPFEIVFAILLALIPFGWTLFGLPPNPIVGTLCWLLCTALAVHWFWFGSGWRKGLQITASVITWVVFAALIILGLFWPHQFPLTKEDVKQAVNEVISREKPKGEDLDTFNVEMRSLMISGDGPLTLFMVGYPSRFSQTASPVFYLAYMQITNNRDTAIALKNIALATASAPDGPWEDLPPIPLSQTTLYALGMHKVNQPLEQGLNTLIFPYGVYSVRTPMHTGDMKRAAILLPNPLESELTKPIPAHQPVYGWVAFDSPKHTRPRQGNFRITLRDTANRSTTYSISLPTKQAGQAPMEFNPSHLQVVKGRTADISRFTVRYYSDVIH